MAGEGGTQARPVAPTILPPPSGGPGPGPQAPAAPDVPAELTAPAHEATHVASPAPPPPAPATPAPAFDAADDVPRGLAGLALFPEGFDFYRAVRLLECAQQIRRERQRGARAERNSKKIATVDHSDILEVAALNADRHGSIPICFASQLNLSVMDCVLRVWPVS